MGRLTRFGNLTTAERLEQSTIDEREISAAARIRSIDAVIELVKLVERERRAAAAADVRKSGESVREALHAGRGRSKSPGDSSADAE